MAVKVTDTCVGCGSCESACPFGAITMEDGRAVIGDACTQCGTCVDICPVGAIERTFEEKVVSVDKAEYKGIWVYLEQIDGESRGVGHELLGQGRKLADELGQELAAVIIGDKVEHLAKEAFASGADKVYLVEGAELAHYNTDAYTIIFSDLINTYKPAALLIGATNDGRDFAPRIAGRVSTGLCADCTNLGVDESTGLVAWTRPAFGGNIMATILCPDHRPQMGTVRPKVFKRPEPDYSITGEIVRVPSKVQPEDLRVKLVDIIRVCTGETCKIEEADIICAGGMGMGNAQNFKLLEELAAAIGGAVGASRLVTEAGWCSPLLQIGQTGKTVSPKIYFACGISGAIQHVAGIRGSDIIIAINKDPEAPIFEVANYGIVGDVMEIIPALIEEFKKIKQAQ